MTKIKESPDVVTPKYEIWENLEVRSQLWLFLSSIQGTDLEKISISVIAVIAIISKSIQLMGLAMAIIGMITVLDRILNSRTKGHWKCDHASTNQTANQDTVKPRNT